MKRSTTTSNIRTITLNSPLVIGLAALFILAIVAWFFIRSKTEQAPIEQVQSGTSVADKIPTVNYKAAPLKVNTVENFKHSNYLENLGSNVNMFVQIDPGKIKPLVNRIANFQNKLMSTKIWKEQLSQIAEAKVSQTVENLKKNKEADDSLNAVAAKKPSFSADALNQFYNDYLGQISEILIATAKNGNQLPALLVSGQFKSANLPNQLQAHFAQNVPFTSNKDSLAISISAKPGQVSSYNIKIEDQNRGIGTSGSVVFAGNEVKASFPENFDFFSSENGKLVERPEFVELKPAFLAGAVVSSWMNQDELKDILFSFLKDDLMAQESDMTEESLRAELDKLMKSHKSTNGFSLNVAEGFRSRDCGKIDSKNPVGEIVLKAGGNTGDSNTRLASLLSDNTIFGMSLNKANLDMIVSAVKNSYSDEAVSQVKADPNFKFAFDFLARFGDMIEKYDPNETTFAISIPQGIPSVDANVYLDHKKGLSIDLLRDLNSVFANLSGKGVDQISSTFNDNSMTLSVNGPTQPIRLVGKKIETGKVLFTTSETSRAVTAKNIGANTNYFSPGSSVAGVKVRDLVGRHDSASYLSTKPLIAAAKPFLGFFTGGKASPQDIEEILTLLEVEFAGFHQMSKQGQAVVCNDQVMGAVE